MKTSFNYVQDIFLVCTIRCFKYMPILQICINVQSSVLAVYLRPDVSYWVPNDDIHLLGRVHEKQNSIEAFQKVVFSPSLEHFYSKNSLNIHNKQIYGIYGAAQKKCFRQFNLSKKWSYKKCALSTILVKIGRQKNKIRKCEKFR